MKRDAGPYVIASGQSLGPAISLDSVRLAAIQMPAAWTAANLTFQGSVDGTNFFDVFDGVAAGAEVTVGAAASRYIILNPDVFSQFSSVKIRSGTSGAAVAQGAARTLQLVTIPLGW